MCGGACGGGRQRGLQLIFRLMESQLTRSELRNIAAGVDRYLKPYFMDIDPLPKMWC